MQFIVQAFVFLLQTALGCAGVDPKLTPVQSTPQGATSLGTTAVVQSGVAALTISRGSGETMHTCFTGYWTHAGSWRKPVRNEAAPSGAALYCAAQWTPPTPWVVS
ncbi:MAG TPA: hypothetical protein VMH22_12570 [bacterium]|nr:hypothetical protein [bacterium]